MRVLVTGASGQVGGAIAAHLAAEGHGVVGLSRRSAELASIASVQVDIGAPQAADEMAELAPRCDAIVHAAAAVTQDPHDPAVSLTNCLGTQQLISLAERWQAERFVYISGVPVIGRPLHVPVTEEHPPAPLTAYTASKLYGEYLVGLAERRGMSATSLRITAPVGPGTPPHRIVAVFVRRAIAGQALEVLGEGSRRQDYVDVRDVAAAVDGCLGNDARGVFNVARGEAISNLELAHTCVRVLDSSSGVESGARPDPEEGIAWEVSIARAGAELGYAPRHGIEDSIRAVAAEV